MKKKRAIIIFFIYFVFIILGLIFIGYLEKQSKNPDNKKTNIQKKVTTSVKATCFFPQVKTKYPQNTKIFSFNLKVNDRGFIPKQIKVPKGAIVEINLFAEEGFHNFNLEEYAICSPPLTTQKTQNFSFVADRPGEFRFYSDTWRYETKPVVEGILVVQ